MAVHPVTRSNLRDELNRLGRAEARVRLGDVLYDLIGTVNKQNDAIAALKAAVGAPAAGVAVPADVKFPEER